MISVCVSSVIIVKEYGAYKKQSEKLKEEWKKENFKISLVFDLDTTKKNNILTWQKGRNTDAIIRYLNDEGYPVTYEEIEKTKAEFEDVVDNTEAQRNRKKIMKMIDDYCDKMNLKVHNADECHLTILDDMKKKGYGWDYGY
ncbi:hypothetical protein AXF17_07000 [Mogibacterium pumilum]|uniref:Uncharacterized protein n=1 Tax=Mogibacterium pumilum TaxID=86332 RepID=A0A223AT83_9FIRM|nr:hypothetical protein AXF17_07000 [Mogibacterium pumilum]